MSLLGNLLWIFLGGGIFLFLEYLFGCLVLCVTIVGIPFGLQCIKLAAARVRSCREGQVLQSSTQICQH
jgi:uncharacterized membrane protein YccF (DUF307 family)